MRTWGCGLREVEWGLAIFFGSENKSEHLSGLYLNDGVWSYGVWRQYERRRRRRRSWI